MQDVLMVHLHYTILALSRDDHIKGLIEQLNAYCRRIFYAYSTTVSTVDDPVKRKWYFLAFVLLHLTRLCAPGEGDDA